MARQTWGFNEAAGIPRGRRSRCRPRWPCRPRASMRPRVFPAEDAAAREHYDAAARLASMRPRVFPAEDACTARIATTATPLQ